MNMLMECLNLVWRLPLVLASWTFYHTSGLVLRRLIDRKIRRSFGRGEFLKWSGMSEGLRAKPMLFPYLMVTAPRWNCHAVIGIAGPLQLRKNLSVRIEHAFQAAEQWTMVVYSNGFSTVTMLSSTELDPREPWHHLDLEPGPYRLALRYYGCRQGAMFPELELDGERRIEAHPIGNEPDDYQTFLHQIRTRDGRLYAAMFYYMAHLLRWRSWLPESLVTREFLPVGNPETGFLYGYLRRGESLTITLPDVINNLATVHLSIYDLRSFPIYWKTLEHPYLRTPSAAAAGFYLLRVHRKQRLDLDALLAEIEIRPETGTGSMVGEELAG